MKSSALGILRRLQDLFLLAVFLLAAGCVDIISPPDPREGGMVAISVSTPARTIAPQINQFSKIEISFERQDGAGTLSPVLASGGQASIYLPQGRWELTASAYNREAPQAIVAQATNTLTRAGNEVSGETNFVLAPTGTGPGTLSYTVALPKGMENLSGAIRIERNGETLEERSLEEGKTGTFSLDGGRYIAHIAIEAAETDVSAVFREVAVVLPGLVTTISYAPAPADFLDPEVRAALAEAPSFGLTANNGSHTVIEEAGAGAQRLSAPRDTDTVFFVLEKAAAQTVRVGGEDAARVSMGEADGEVPGDTRAVFAVDASDMMVGDRVFALTLAEPGKEDVDIAVTVTLGYITELSIGSPPTKSVYILGDNFDPSGMVLTGKYRDGGALAEPDLSHYRISGFDSSRPGLRTIQVSVRGKTAGAGFIISVNNTNIRDLYFDYGKRRSAALEDKQPDRYTVPLGRTLVLAPVKWHIPDGAVYEWKVDGEVQPSASEYLSITPTEQDKSYAVTVTAKIGGAVVGPASTTVVCVDPEGDHKRSQDGNRVAEKIKVVPAPGQFVNGAAWTGLSLGAWGGFNIYKFDHSVEKGSGGEIKIEGNAFGVWQEPGTVWVMQDEDGDGEPNNTWYELKGNLTLLPETKRRYAVTYTKENKDVSWKDNYGATGTLGGWPVGAPSPMTFVGTGLSGPWGREMHGYVDIVDSPRFSIDDAIQADGSPVDLKYIDFVKVQTALNVWADIFGEISTEVIGLPQDNSYKSPDRLLTGTASGGLYDYRFINNSGYALTITLGDGDPFILAAGYNVIKKLSLNQAYFDYYGGNVTHVGASGTVTFTDKPEEGGPV
jgi:hypothetical protein